MKALITGFSPFGGDAINPAQEILDKLPDTIGDIQIVRAQVPTAFYTSIQVLESLIDQEQPDMVLCLGQAGGAYKIRVEQVAINLNEARIPDNAGNQPLNEAINPKGETAYFSSLPVKAMVADLIQAGIPAEVSYTAGTFVCNHLFYGLMDMIRSKELACLGGFVHIPYLPKQAAEKGPVPSMSLPMMVQATCLMIQTMARNEQAPLQALGRLD